MVFTSYTHNMVHAHVLYLKLYSNISSPALLCRTVINISNPCIKLNYGMSI